MHQKEIERFAAYLDDATRRGYEVERLTLQVPALSLEEAYQIQRQGTLLRHGRGEVTIGYKMGLTSEAKRQQMNLSSAVYGPLTDKMQIDDGGIFSLEGTIHPKIEPEVAFITSKELKGKVSIEEACSAVQFACPALEILDSRYKDFKYFSLPDVIADNCSSSFFILGKDRISLAGVDLSALRIHLKIDGRQVEQALSREISGNPIHSLMQLCDLLDSHGLSLPTGSVVLAGAATRAVSLESGMSVEVEIEKMGHAAIKIV